MRKSWRCVMKTATLPVVLVFVLASVVSSVSLTDRMPEKTPQHNDPGVPDGRQGGETIEDAWVIDALPFYDTGNTCDNINDYDEACPYTGSTAPDVVYSYTPTEDACLSINLCDSYYDTKVYVYEDTWTPGSPVGCNDDNLDCVNPPVSYTSWIAEVRVYADHTYYIVIDGYGTACGDYVLDITSSECYELDCVGTPEGEPTCHYNYVDHYNGGCNSTPSSFQLSHGDMFWCGESGVYEVAGGLLYRDTDWYLLGGTIGDITMTVEAEFGVIFGFVNADDCDAAYFYEYMTAPRGVPTTLTRYIYNPWALDRVVAYVAPSSWNPDYECGTEYSLEITGDWWYYNPVEPVSWGAIKALYREASPR
jgi:hypothetical protein